MKMSKKRIPAELFFEICHSLPFRLRWATDRVALAFDNFVLKIQCVWIKTEFAHQIKIEQKKHLLTKAKSEFSKVTEKLFDRNLSTIFDGISFEFRVDFDFGVEGMDLRGMTSLKIFNKKLEKILAERVDYEDPNAIERAARFLVSQINYGLLLLSYRTDFANGKNAHGMIIHLIIKARKWHKSRKISKEIGQNLGKNEWGKAQNSLPNQ